MKNKRTKKRTRKKSNKTYTFKCNRSDILNELLIGFGFKEEKEAKIVDFSLWDTYEQSAIESRIKCIDRDYVNPIDNKRNFYDIMKKYNLEHHTPKTHPFVTKVTSDMLDGKKLHFLKHIHGSGGKDVYPVKTKIDINKIVKDDPDNYLLQEEVNNMYLHDGKYKTTMRNYAMICDEGIYFYNEGYVYIYREKYDRNCLDCKIHNAIFTACDYEKLSKQPYYKRILPQLCKICSQLLHQYFKNFNLKNRYIILGIDFIIDKNYKPYIIEINGFPNLNKSCGESEVKQDMLNDFVKLYVLTTTKKKKPILGGWYKI